MALATSVKELLINLFNQNKTKIGDYADTVIGEIQASVESDITLQARAEQNLLIDYKYYPNGIPEYDKAQIRMLLTWYDTKNFLDTYTTDTIWGGKVGTGGIEYSKADFLRINNTSNMLFYLGTGGADGKIDTQPTDPLLSFYRYYNETLSKLNGCRYKQLTYGNAYYVASPKPIGGGYNINEAYSLFDMAINWAHIDESLSITTNTSHLDLYDAMDTEKEPGSSLIFMIQDDLDSELYHMFKVYNKNKVFKMFKLWNLSIYYPTLTDLTNLTNPKSFDDLDPEGPIYPDTDTEPNNTTNPGQVQNTVHNQQVGTGDWSSEEVTTPQSPYTGTGIGNCLYTINLKQMYKVRNELFRPDIISSFFIDNESLLGCSIWPFKYSGDGLYTVNEIVIGKYHVQLMGDSSITPYAYAILPTYIPKVYVAQGVSIQPKNGNFLDYAPYTKIKFYLPYIGIVDVDPCDIYDHTIDIYYLYEPTTGKGKGCIKSSSGVTYSWDCMLGTSVPFTISNMNQLMQNLALAGVKAAGVYATGGLGMMGEVYSATEVISSLAGNISDFKISSTGSTGDSMGRLEPQEVYCITIGPYTRIPDDYNKNYGRPSLITVPLNKLKGFTTVPNPLFTTTATDTEKAEIVALLQGGVIING